MLSELHIENIAIIKKAAVKFTDGFNVLTGETGAGKSILIDSINAILGERTSKELIRTGCEKASVSAMFIDLDSKISEKLAKLGFSPCENELLINRTLSIDGKSTAKINGQPSTAGILKEIAYLLINIHGQHDSGALLDSDMHYLYLDKIAGNNDIYNEYLSIYKETVDTKLKLKHMTMNEQEKKLRLQTLRYQIDEIETANIQPGEKDELYEKRAVYKNAEKLSELLSTAYLSLNGEDEIKGAADLLENAVQNITTASHLIQKFEPICEKLNSVLFDTQEICIEIAKSLSTLDFNQNELDEIEERLDIIYKILSKYGDTEEDVLNSLQEKTTEFENINGSEEEIAQLENRLEDLKERLIASGKKLTNSRKTTAAEFEKRISDELKYMDMPNIIFKTRIEKTKYSSTGCDEIEFLISPNLGEKEKPLAKIASGGELSRIMLALKNIISQNDMVDTLIFDEIDTGISGHAATKVGSKLSQTAKNKQVICVTHLAQIAAFANTHLLIEKESTDGKTYTNVQTLDYNGRKKEIARIMSSEITELTLKNAEELINRSRGDPRGRPSS